MNRLRKAVTASEKKYPSIKDHYRFYMRACRVKENKALRKKEGKRLINALYRALAPYFSFEKQNFDLNSFAVEYFTNHSPNDAEFFLFDEALTAAVLEYLSKVGKEHREKALVFAFSVVDALEKLNIRRLYHRYSAVNKILSSRNFLYYPQCDLESRAYIRSLVYTYAKRHRIKDGEAAQLIDADSIEKRTAIRKRVFVCLIVFLPILFLILTLAVCGIVETLFLALPMLCLSLEIIQSAASLFISPAPILKFADPEIEKKVVVVITTLLTKKEDAALFGKKLERMFLQNKEKNIVFGLLADYKDAEKAVMPQDEEILSAAVGTIEELNRKYGEKFCFFMRRRSYAPSEKRFMGRERKRGALIELITFLKHGKGEFEKVILPPSFLRQTAYLLTLDADTELCMGAVKRMYAAMIHPANKPRIKGSVVVSGYGVLQPRMATSVESAGKTPFSALFSGGAGTDNYDNAIFDFYESVFGKGAFCGKGMIDIAAFDRVITGRFPEGRILSHDLLEGTRLRCGYMSEMTLTDSFPSNPLSYFKRKHRWLRGDYQSFPFALPHLPFEKEKRKNPIGGVSKFMILSNIVRALTPIASAFALLFSTLLDEGSCAVFLFFSFGYLLLPLLFTVCRTIKNVGRRFYSTVLQNVYRGVLEALSSLCSLFYNAQLSLDALLRVIYRSFISKKKLLEWSTAGENDAKAAAHTKAGQFFRYLKSSLPSTAMALLLLFNTSGGVVRLLAVLFLLYPFGAFLLSIPYEKKKGAQSKQITQLKEYAKDSFSYFERFVTEKEHYLPPDNYQETPVSAIAHRTSPTNIALYLLSVGAMHDLGLLEEEAMYDKLERTISTVEKLPKYRGHLYNWYDTTTCDILGQAYISSVDSGNYALALISLGEALKEKEDLRAEELVKRIDALTVRLDFSFLFDPDKELLAIGYDLVSGKRSENCYDLLSSEARSAYYFAIAKGQIPRASWSKLERPVTVRDGHFGILSWSGTAFEYFMPALFLPVYENTLLYEALCFACFEQARDKTKGFYGRSESCYYAFDRAMNYQYKAFGSSALAIDRSIRTEDVIAPYASFLFLPFDLTGALHNLQNLKNAGMYGKHGFYEALDFTPARVGRGSAVISSYMAHHIGMSILSIANCCLDGLIVKRTLDDKSLEAATELLKESIPCDAQVSSLSRRRTRILPPPRITLHSFQAPEKAKQKYALLYKNGVRILAREDGHIGIFSHDIALTPPLLPERTPETAMRVLLRTKNHIFDIQRTHDGLFCDGKQICFVREEKRFNCRLALFPTADGAAVIHAEASEDLTDFAFFAPIPFSSVAAYRTHPAFEGLTVEAEYDKQENILFFRKRKREEDAKDLYLAFAFADASPFSFCSSFDDLPILRPENGHSPLFDADLHGRIGALRLPVCLIVKKFTERQSADLIAVMKSDKTETLGVIRNLRQIAERQDLYRSHLSARVSPLEKRREYGIEPKVLHEYISLLLEGCYRFARFEKRKEACAIDRLWQYGISGDHPIFTFLMPERKLDESTKKTLKGLLSAHKTLLDSGIRADLIFIQKENEHYYSPARKEFERLMTETVGLTALRTGEGIYYLTDETVKEIAPSFSRVYIELPDDCIFQVFKMKFLSCLAPETVKKPHDLLYTRRESFSQPPEELLQKEGIVLDKPDTPVPFSYIYSGKQFGTLLTSKSLGFTFFRNAGEFRLTPFSSNEIEGFYGEKLILLQDNKETDLCRRSEKTIFGEDHAQYYGKTEELRYTLSVGCDFKYPVKMLLLRLENASDRSVEGKLRYEILPCLGKSPDGYISSRSEGGDLFFKRSVRYNEIPCAFFVSPHKADYRLEPGEQKEIVFLLGCYDPSFDRCYYALKERFGDPSLVREAFARYKEGYDRFLSRFSLRSGFFALDEGMRRHFPYQVSAARLFGRVGFYQPGGAYGFRDQLQDALCMLPYDENLLRIQLLRASAHQYAEGDVQHWWHVIDLKEGFGDRGVRTNCTDDLLFLPFCTAHYLSFTGDLSLLDEKIRYLSSPPLEGLHDRYERPQKTARKESLYYHCLRAIEKAASRRNDEGLLYIGSSDWNDGLSGVGGVPSDNGGAKRAGTSVWLTQFFCLTVKEFLPFAKENDGALLEDYYKTSKAALDGCFADGQYLRAFDQKGEPLGKKGNPYCEIDLLPQAFSVFLEENDLSRRAILEAYRMLWDKDNRLFKLFTPPYSNNGAFPGYLGAYCPGFRENGGQYTHAAVWGAAALLAANENEKGFETLLGITPIESSKNSRYMLEPYAFAGDVYTAKGYVGRGGWSLYTGSAGWFVFTLLTLLLGYKEEEGAFFTLHPHLSSSFPSFTLFLDKKNTKYRIEAALGEKNAIELDGKEAENRFFFDKGDHIIKMFLQKTKE